MARTSNRSRYARYKQYAQGVIYHIYNRGNGKKDIFMEDADYKFYLNRLGMYVKKHNVSLLCYVLMPNHIHLVVKQETPIPIHKFISSIHTSYGMYFNKKHNQTGHLFQDRFKQVIVETDEQFIHLTRYIHQNPLHAGLTKSLDAYFWSSYHEFLRNIPQPLCNKELIAGLLTSKPELFSSSYEKFCNESLEEKDAVFLDQLALETF